MTIRSCVSVPRGTVICTGGGGGLTSVANIGTGAGDVFSSISGGDTINLRTLYGSGGTTITTSGDTIIINSTSGGGSTSPGGTDGQIQYNNAGSFGGSLFEYDDSICRFGMYGGMSACTILTICEPSDLYYDLDYDYIRTFTTDGYTNFVLMNSGTGGNGNAVMQVSEIIDGAFDNFGVACPLTLGGNCVIVASTQPFKICSVMNISAISYLPLSPVEGDVIRLNGHSTCSDGIWVYTGTAWQSISTW